MSQDVLVTNLDGGMKRFGPNITTANRVKVTQGKQGIIVGKREEGGRKRGWEGLERGRFSGRTKPSRRKHSDRSPLVIIWDHCGAKWIGFGSPMWSAPLWARRACHT